MTKARTISGNRIKLQYLAVELVAIATSSKTEPPVLCLRHSLFSGTICCIVSLKIPFPRELLHLSALPASKRKVRWSAKVTTHSIHTTLRQTQLIRTTFQTNSTYRVSFSSKPYFI
ncbi:hypothetical protein KC19_5G060600 [Ceratodon purpureus]|uniref:Uncharacterized protein n=1 Tax=Ceratodon purpureus TaxID=3225 RepID=A0A8T0HYD0_CERPU|nr:hypothetical protein KC19_5G060600 [Ceratodon purpureus]